MTGQVGLLNVGADEAVIQILQFLNGQIQHLSGGHNIIMLCVIQEAGERGDAGDLNTGQITDLADKGRQIVQMDTGSLTGVDHISIAEDTDKDLLYLPQFLSSAAWQKSAVSSAVKR